MSKSSDPIVQCLEATTDDRAFELLCSDILAGTVCPGIEPIGGTGDGGRDALYCDDESGVITICAYSLRHDWATKLREDCDRIKFLSHKCDRVIFSTSMQPSPAERDKAVGMVKDSYQWSLELYGRERLATAIRGRLEHLLERHPSIFPSDHFRLAGGRLLETSRRDLLVVDHIDQDQGFAHWIARCLRLVGFDVWCRGIDLTSGEIADQAIRDLLNARARHHLPVMSNASISRPDFRGRIEQSVAVDRRLLPLRMESVDLSLLSSRVSEIDPVAFEVSRTKGIRELCEKLEEWGAPKDHEVIRRRRESLRLPSPNDFIRHESETLLSNVFPIEAMPELIQEWRSTAELKRIQIQTARRVWPFVISGRNIYSFTTPPSDFGHDVTPRPWKGAEWKDVDLGYYDGKMARDIVSELLWRTLEFAFYRAGLLWCPDRELLYFDPSRHSGKRLPVRFPSGDGTTRAVCGEKHRWRPHDRGEDYNWQLAPDWRCFGGFRDPWEIRSRVMIRVVYRDGTPIESKRVITFRKHATTNWYQDKFRDLTLLFMQHAALGEPSIVVGEGSERVEISICPRTFISQVGINEAAMPKGSNKFAKRVEHLEDGLDESGLD